MRQADRKARATAPKPSKAAMGALMRAHGLEITDAELDLFWRFHGLLREHNARLDLTRLHGFEAIVVRHYVDCGLVERMMPLPSPLLDIGTGPGFPGIPLAILSPGTHFVLADTRSKRTGFLEQVVRDLGLANVEVWGHKILPDWGRRMGGVITRAVEAIPATLDRCAGFVEVGGQAIFMKGPDCDAEIAEAARTHAAPWRLARDEAYTIRGTTLARRLVVYERLRDARPAAEIREIASASNETFKTLRASLGARGIKRSGLGIVGGRRIAREIARDHPEAVGAWIVLEERGKTLAGGVEPPAGAAIYRMPKALFRELDFPGAGPPLVAVKVPEIAPWRPEDAPEGCTLVLALQDPENVGAAIRSAAAFGVRNVALLEEAAHPFHPKALRAAGVAALGVRLWKGPSIESLETGPLPLFALALEGRPLAAVRWPRRFALVAGTEGPGLPERLRRSADALAIPIAPAVESLNAAVAISIALYEWRRGAAPSED